MSRLAPGAQATILVILTAIAIPRAVSAQEVETTIPDTIVVTAPAPTESSDPGIEVIDVADLNLSGDATVADVVAAVPSVTIQRRGSRYEPATVSIRGSTSEQVLLLRDGRPLSDSRGGIVDLSRISLANIERIEVIRGAATALYGEGGAAGAINLISSSPDSPRGNLSGSSRVSVGSLRDVRVSGLIDVGLTDAVSISTSGSGVFAENRYTYERNGNRTSRINGGGREGDLSVAVDALIGPEDDRSGRIESTASASAGRRGLPGTIEFPSSSAEMDNASVAFDVGYTARDRDIHRWTLEGNASAVLKERGFRDEEYPLGAIDEHARIARLASHVVVAGTLSERVSVTVGTAGSAEWMDDSELGKRRRDRVALTPALHSSWAVGDAAELRIGAHGRGEIIRDESVTTLPSSRVTAAWTTPVTQQYELEIATAVGTAYRLPSFSELFWPSGAFATGNPDLRPERSRMGELAVKVQSPGQLSLELRGHGAWYQDLIKWVPDPRGVWQPRNTEAARILGVETIGTIRGAIGVSPWDFGIQAALEYLQAVDRSDGATRNLTLPYRAELSSSGEIDLSHISGHTVALQARAVGPRPVTEANTRWLDPYVAVNVNGEFHVPGTSMVIGGAVNNVLDDHFIETRFYPNPGREVVFFAEVSL